MLASDQKPMDFTTPFQIQFLPSYCIDQEAQDKLKVNQYSAMDWKTNSNAPFLRIKDLNITITSIIY